MTRFHCNWEMRFRVGTGICGVRNRKEIWLTAMRGYELDSVQLVIIRDNQEVQAMSLLRLEPQLIRKIGFISRD